MSLYTRFGNIAQSLFTFVGNVLPIPGSNFFFREQFGTHPHTVDSGFDPCGQVLFRRSHAARHHKLGPWAGCHHPFHESRAVHVTGEELAKVAAQFLCLADFRYCAASRTVGHQTAVAYRYDVRIEQRPYHEASS